jgi:hypothetical protein
VRAGRLLLSYNYRPLPKFRVDNVLSNVACVAAVGVALLPTASRATTASGGEQLVAVLHPPGSWHALFWLESVGVVAFGISWLVKGFAPPLWADRQRA